MKKKILVIFSFAIIISFIIYKITYIKNNNLLIIAETNTNTNIIINKLKDKYKINTFLYDNINYKELLKSIKNNDYIIIKNKKVYLNQLISSSNIIIININNYNYIMRCLSNKITTNYINNIYNDKGELIKTIDRFSNSKIYFIDNSCTTINIDKYIKDL